jgi:RNA polymerase sigma-70 factor (ECF subfamily)
MVIFAAGNGRRPSGLFGLDRRDVDRQLGVSGRRISSGLRRHRIERGVTPIRTDEGGMSLSTDRGEHELLRAARRDADAFAELAGLYLPLIRGWAYTTTRDFALSNDVAAESLARAWLGRRGYRGRDDAAACGWLFGIARNVLREGWRKERFERVALRRLRVSVPAADEFAEVEQRLEAESQRGVLAGELELLTQAQRDALSLRVVAELPYDEVARRLDRSEVATRLLVSRALARLRRRAARTNP